MTCAGRFAPVSNVLVAFDGGPSSLRAIKHIAQSPLYKGMAVTVVSVGEDSAPAAVLGDAVAQLVAAGVEADSRHIAGQPETALAKLAEDEGFQLVVMGAYGHSRIRNLIIGSTTTAMIRSCKVPLMLMR